jgi:hypothetical protein
MCFGAIIESYFYNDPRSAEVKQLATINPELDHDLFLKKQTRLFAKRTQRKTLSPNWTISQGKQVTVAIVFNLFITNNCETPPKSAVALAPGFPVYTK